MALGNITAYIETLRENGIEEPIAMAHAKAIAELRSSELKTLAGKASESAARSRLKTLIDEAIADLKAIRTDVTVIKTEVLGVKETLERGTPWQADLAKLENRLLLRFGAMLAAGVTFLTLFIGFVK